MIDSNHKMILSSGRFSGTKRTDLTRAFDTFASSPQKNTLILHFHGGLVSEQAAETIAESLSGTFQGAGGYPLFVIWQSHVHEALRNNWQEIIREEALKILVERTVQFLLGKLDQAPARKGEKVELPAVFTVQDEVAAKQSQGIEPFVERNAETGKLDEELSPQEKAQFENLLKNDPLLENAGMKLARPEGPELNPELQAELDKASAATQPGQKGLITSTALITAGLRIIGRALKRFAGGRDHGLYTTVVEETVRELKGDTIGSLLWRLMKQDTADAFADPEAEFGGTALLKEIDRLWQSGGRPRIVLVGHSAGSIYICNLLKKAATVLPPEVKFDVVFLAPACTFKLLDEVLGTAGDRIRSLRSYGMNDDNERKDAIFPPLYLYSLLYFVSGVLEDEVDSPLVGMERFSSKNSKFDQSLAPEIGRVLQKLASFQSPWVWSGSDGGPGLVTLAHSHGDFDNEEQTLKSIVHLIQNGGV